MRFFSSEVSMMSESVVLPLSDSLDSDSILLLRGRPRDLFAFGGEGGGAGIAGGEGAAVVADFLLFNIMSGPILLRFLGWNPKNEVQNRVTSKY